MLLQAWTVADMVTRNDATQKVKVRYKSDSRKRSFGP